MNTELEGRVALITGGASGIGKACASALYAEGARVVIADVSQEAGLASVQDISAQGGWARFVACDVSQENAVEAAVKFCLAEAGGLDVMVNNAGVGVSRLPWWIARLQIGTGCTPSICVGSFWA